MRVATFNMENLFRRPRVMNVEEWSQGRPALEAIAELNELIAHEVYSKADKKRIAEILTDYGLAGTEPGPRLFTINQVREKLYVVHRNGVLEVVAKGRKSWLGWVDLVTDTRAEIALENTGRVVDAMRPDILVCVEIEDRLALQRFNDQVLLTRFPAAAFPYNMLVDGNDTRGIDVGILSRHPIVSVRSHIFDGGTQPVFSRDCAEYDIALPGGETLVILANHFKSKGYGNPRQSAARRRRQADRVKEIYLEALKRSEFVIVAGDLNDSPDSAPIKVLTGAGLRDVMAPPFYTGKPGTYGTGNSATSKIDYLLLSPGLFPKLTAAQVERRGVFAPRAGNPFPEVTSKADQASDHGALYADLQF
jgi:endonuclease/exonuclease/phosphatase family metal-dependent hydrolase